MKISVTKLSTFIDCPRKYWYIYDMRIFTPKGEGFYFGSAVHEGLERYYLGQDPMQGVKDALYGEKGNISEEPQEGINLAKLENEARRIFRIYEQQAPYLDPLLVEHIFNVPLVHPKTKERLPAVFTGKMDLITTSCLIVDHKTASSSPGSFFEAKNNLQASGYTYAYLQMFGMMPKGFLFNNIIKGNTRREPRFEPNRKDKTIEDCCDFFDVCKEILRKLKRKETKDYPNRHHCRFCRYKSICPYYGT